MSEVAEEGDENPHIDEVYNEDKIPWRDLSDYAQAVLCSRWREVEWYNRDACAWVPNEVCPRQWDQEAYRLPKSAFPTIG